MTMCSESAILMNPLPDLTVSIIGASKLKCSKQNGDSDVAKPCLRLLSCVIFFTSPRHHSVVVFAPGFQLSLIMGMMIAYISDSSDSDFPLVSESMHHKVERVT